MVQNRQTIGLKGMGMFAIPYWVNVSAQQAERSLQQ
jgi:hypothetical protein